MFAVLALAVLLGSASAFMAPSARTSRNALSMIGDRSKALPFDARPAALDGSLPGDAGFDPAGFTIAPGEAIGVSCDGFKWFREAEIVHSRVAMLAIVGLLFPGWYHFPGTEWTGVDAYAEMNPYTALTTVPAGALLQIALTAGVVEYYRVKRVINGDKEPGDLGLGQGGWNPFNFQYTPEEYFEKQTQEIKHGRLAMFAALGGLLQVKNTGMGLSTQVSELLSLPDARDVLVGPGTLNDYFPPNI